MTTTLRILIVCFSGTLIGGLIGLQLNFPIIGLVVGCLGGYVAADLGAAQAALVRTYWVVRSDYKAELKKRYPALFREAPIVFRAIGSLFRSFVNCFIAVFALIVLSMSPIVLIQDGYVALMHWFDTDRLLLTAFISVSVSFSATVVHCVSRGKVVKSIPNPAICIFRFIMTVLAAIRSIGEGACILAVCILKGIKKFLIMIHTDFRLLCACNIALGTSIGYYAGNALIGAVAGGILGVMNYRLISVKLLKLAPAQRA